MTWAIRSGRRHMSGSRLAKDGTWMIVEPFANDQLKDNLNPVGRVYYSFSTLLCTPCSRSQEVGLCLGCAGGASHAFGRSLPRPGLAASAAPANAST